MVREKEKNLNKRLYILKKVLRCLGKKKGFKQAVVYSQKGLEMVREKEKNLNKRLYILKKVLRCLGKKRKTREN